jgi:hypothetical protein
MLLPDEQCRYEEWLHLDGWALVGTSSRAGYHSASLHTLISPSSLTEGVALYRSLSMGSRDSDKVMVGTRGNQLPGMGVHQFLFFGPEGTHPPPKTPRSPPLSTLAVSTLCSGFDSMTPQST